MSDFETKVIEDSVSGGVRLTTLTCKYPRFVHSELMTHRVFSRNSASSRAIPSSKMRAMIMSEPVVPIEFGTELKGMQTGAPVTGIEDEVARAVWLEARNAAQNYADLLGSLGDTMDRLRQGENIPGLERLVGKFDIPQREPIGWNRVHKSITNRLTEPFMWITIVLSGTDFKNFLGLRVHEAAEVHMRRMAEGVKSALSGSVPVEREADGGEESWHMPFVSQEERSSLDLDTLKKVSVGRVARVSYLTHEGIRDLEADVALHDRLKGSDVMHASPFEHVATPGFYGTGNFRGWMQYRKTFENESVPG